jgi:hypothetical protein
MGPQIIQSDGGSHFLGSLVGFCTDHNIHHSVSTAYYAQTNGKVERLNGEVVSTLRKYLGGRFDQWDTYLSQVQSHLNSSLNRSIGCSPFEAKYGYPPVTLAQMASGNASCAPDTPAELQRLINAVHAVILVRQDVAALISKQQYDSTHKHVEFAVDSQVLVFYPNKSVKMAQYYRGPYTVVRRISDVNYVVRGVFENSPLVSVHVARMRKFKNDRTTNDLEVAAMLPAGEFMVESVLGHRRNKNGLRLHVKWMLFPESESSWTDVSLVRLSSVVKTYLRKHGLPVPPSSPPTPPDD